MQNFSAKPSLALPSPDPATAIRGSRAVERVASSGALLAIAVWMGGLLALGAIAAPVVFAVTPFPASADAMTIVFRRFDLVAMTCGALVLVTEALRVGARVSFRWSDHTRALLSLAAAAAAVLEGTSLSPRIAELHGAGVLRGAGPAGEQLARLHDAAKACGEAQLFLLAAAVVLHVVTLSATATKAPAARMSDALGGSGAGAL